jgi:sulfite dehydrogenase (quinone) subunit SoeC
LSPLARSDGGVPRRGEGVFAVNPAYSVILFTTASGAGYGLLALLGLVGFNHGPASSLGFALTALVVALGLITIGLLSSTLHLGRPGRAWRAFSQWRSSWLSREGVLAVLTFPFALAFGAAWCGYAPAALIAPLGVVTAVLCAATVLATGKIYATLITIPAWNTSFTVPVYLVLALGTGACLLAVIALMFGRFQVFQLIVAVAALLAALVLKWLYWRHIDVKPMGPSTGEATGLGKNVRQWEVPHTNINFIQKEMGFVVARKHAATLRKLVLALLVLAILACVLAWIVTPWFVLVAALAALVAVICERWLFFAEARHIVMAYYQG